LPFYPRKTTNQLDYENAYYKVSLQRSLDVLQLFFTNNKYLLKKRGITLYRQLRDLEEAGVSVDYSNIAKYTKRKNNVCSLTYLSFFCEYWDKTLSEMISCNMEQRDKELKEYKDRGF